MLFKTQPIGNLKINLTPLVTVDDGRDRKKDGKMTKKTEIYQRKNSCPAKSSPFSDAAS